MRVSTALLATAMVFGLGWTAGQVFSQDGGMEGKKAEEKPAPAGPSPEEMAAWEKAGTPGDPHKKMAAQEGAWEATGKYWMAPDQPPVDTKGGSKFRMLFGGRYQVQEYSGDMMGMPFEGMGLAGYDNVKKKYFSVWVDSMSTAAFYSEGTADEKGVVTCVGEMPDALTGKNFKMRTIMADKDKDAIHFEMFVDKSDGKGEAKCMELTYTRKK